MRVRLNLFSRSVILTAFPVFCQLIFIVFLTVVLQDAQKNLEKQWQSENLIKLTFNISRSGARALVWLQMPPDMREAVGPDISSSYIAQVRRDMDIMRRIAAQDPVREPAITRMLYAAGQMFNYAQTMLHSPPERTLDNLYRFRASIKTIGKSLFDGIDEMIAIEKKHHDDVGAYSAAFARAYATLFAAVIVSVLVAIFLGYMYAISIKRPLNHLSENGKLLSARQPLLPQLPVKDEFGRLDAVLHTTAREINATLEKERLTIENAAELICTLDSSGLFSSVNPVAEKLLGYKAGELSGRALNSITVPEQSLLADEFVRNAVVSSAVQQFELSLIQTSGQTVETRWSCLWSPAENKLFCVVRDVTEEKKVELLKQDFANMISHDLRSPLMAMGNAFTLLKSGVKGNLPDDAKKRIEMSARNVEKLIVLVNDLLDFQKLKAGKMELVVEPVAIDQIVRDAAELVEEAAREKSVTVELPEGDTIVNCDRNKLLQTAVNLISNAIKFSGESGKVTISVAESADSVTLSVSDTGPGVPVEFQQRIFEPFEQAPSSKKSEGTGLGLAICKLVVEAHGGSIRVLNRPDDEGVHKAETGSVFVIELPKNTSSAGAA